MLKPLTCLYTGNGDWRKETAEARAESIRTAHGWSRDYGLEVYAQHTAGYFDGMRSGKVRVLPDRDAEVEVVEYGEFGHWAVRFSARPMVVVTTIDGSVYAVDPRWR